MRVNIFDPSAPKKSTNLSINSDLLRQAKERHINLSQALELRLAELLREEIANTVASPDEVEDEIRHLFAVLGEK